MSRVLDDWLSYQRSRIGVDSWRWYEAKVRLYLRPSLCKTPVRSLTRDDVEDYIYSNLPATVPYDRTTPLGEPAIRAIYLTLSAALDFALQRGWIDRNVAKGVEPPTRRIWLVSYCHHRSRAWTTRCLSTVALRRTTPIGPSAEVRNGHSANGIFTPLRLAPLWQSLSTAAHLPTLAVASANFGSSSAELVVHRFSGFCNSRGNEWFLAWATTVSSHNSEVSRRMCLVGASLAPSCVQKLPRLRDIVRWSAYH